MNNTNMFDRVMDRIDKCIHLSDDDIKTAVREELASYSETDFSTFLKYLTNGEHTLMEYIKKRKLSLASITLLESPELSVTEVSSMYSYNDSGTFTRSIRKYFNCTPTEIRRTNTPVKCEKLQFSALVSKPESRLAKILEELMEHNEIKNSSDLHYFESFVDAQNEYGFTTDMCCNISEISGKLGVPFHIMLRECFELMVEYNNYVEEPDEY